MSAPFGLREVGRRPPGVWEVLHDTPLCVTRIYYNGREVLVLSDLDRMRAHEIVIDWRAMKWAELPGYQTRTTVTVPTLWREHE